MSIKFFSTHSYQHLTTQFFIGRMPLLPPSQQCQSPEALFVYNCGKEYYVEVDGM